METQNSEEADIEENEDFICGIGSWKPKWLQKFASPKMFLINFSLVAIVQGASFTYLIGSITTLEKRYGFDSKISGLILIADNFSQMIINPFIGYLGTKYNRPMIMAIGEMIVALSCFIFGIPYFIYGTNESLNSNVTENSLETQLCDPLRNNTCSEVTIWPAVIILWSASFINGIGYTAFYTVGLPYMDDNTSKKDSPMYFGLSGSLRLLGPSFGFFLSSMCLKLNENPFVSSHLEKSDPRWIGAWWIGFIVIGVLIMIFSLPMVLFPINLTPKAVKEESKSTKSELKETMESLKRILKNPIFMFNTFGMCFRILGYLGYYLFKPKYIEAQFRMTASNANFWTALVSIPPMAIGIMAGGIFLSKFRPGARKVVIYIFIIDMITNLAILSVMFIKCQNPVFPQTDLNTESDCKCTKEIYQPVCYEYEEKNLNYFNPCYAGCTHNNKSHSFNCSHIKEGTDWTLTNGYCQRDCNNFYLYIAILGIAGIIMSSAKVGDTLIVLRCVEQRDKNLAMAIIGSFLALFTFIPYPPLFGWITDMACIDWKVSCGKTGNCWRYNIDKFRHYLHLSSFGIIMIGTLFVIPVIFYANRIKDMFEDEEQNENKLYELGSVNEGFDKSINASKNSISVVKIVTNLDEKRRKSSLKDYELVHRKNSFVVL